MAYAKLDMVISYIKLLGKSGDKSSTWVAEK
jgi:hypothetical protein